MAQHLYIVCPAPAGRPAGVKKCRRLYILGYGAFFKLPPHLSRHGVSRHQRNCARFALGIFDQQYLPRLRAVDARRPQYFSVFSTPGGMEQPSSQREWYPNKLGIPTIFVEKCAKNNGAKFPVGFQRHWLFSTIQSRDSAVGHPKLPTTPK